MLKFTKSTCVHYLAGDPVGKLLAYIALLPYAAVLHVASVFYARREAHMLMVLLGLIANEALARGLKHFLKDIRPSDTCHHLNLCHSYGMPSSHTQCMAFAAFLRVLLLARGFSHKRAVTRVVGLLESAVLLMLAAAVAVSRVYLGYHTSRQVEVALVLGASFAIIWFLVMRGVAPMYGRLASSWLGQFASMTDSWHVLEPFPALRARAPPTQHTGGHDNDKHKVKDL